MPEDGATGRDRDVTVAEIPLVRVLGAGGRIGGILRSRWPGEALAPVWSSRDPAIDMAGGMAGGAAPDVILNLAGVTAGEDLAANTALALAALDEGARCGAPVILVSSAAVYGAQAGPLAETAAPAPAAPYGAAKAAMETAAAGRAACILRIGNVAGADALLGGLAPGRPVILDRFADGATPERSYIGPETLARVLAALCRMAAGGRALPAVLNVAQPGTVAMAALARAAGAEPGFRPAPAAAIRRVELDVARLCALMPLAPAAPAGLVAEWRRMAQGRAPAIPCAPVPGSPVPDPPVPGSPVPGSRP